MSIKISNEIYQQIIAKFTTERGDEPSFSDEFLYNQCEDNFTCSEELLGDILGYLDDMPKTVANENLSIVLDNILKVLK